MEDHSEDCIHGVWPASSCVFCNGKTHTVTDDRMIIVARWPAKFDGKCYRCGDDIPKGEPIAIDTEDRYLCESCSA